MTANDEEKILERAKAIVDHLSSGGTLKTLAKLGSAELEAIYAVAYNNFAAGKFDEAVALFKFLCLYDHVEPRWYYSLGVAQQSRRDYPEAVNAFAMATLLDVEDPRPQAQAGYCLAAMERWPEAGSALEGAIAACGGDPGKEGIRKQAGALLKTVRGRMGTAKKEGRP